MRAPIAILAGAGVPLGLCALVYLVSRGTEFQPSAKAGLLSGAFLGALGAAVGCLAARRRHSTTPLLDAARVASIAPAIFGLVASLATSHERGATAGLLTGALVFVPGPLAALVSARLATWPRREGADA